MFFFQAEDGIRDLVRSRGLGDVYKRQRQTHQRVEQAFGGPVGQTEQGFACQAGLDRQVRVRPRLAAPDRSRQRPILSDAGFVKPDRQVATIDQRSIVFRPVLYLVAAFRLCRALVSLRSCCHLDLSRSSKTRHPANYDIILRQRHCHLKHGSKLISRAGNGRCSRWYRSPANGQVPAPTYGLGSEGRSAQPRHNAVGDRQHQEISHD